MNWGEQSVRLSCREGQEGPTRGATDRQRVQRSKLQFSGHDRHTIAQYFQTKNPIPYRIPLIVIQENGTLLPHPGVGWSNMLL